MTNTDDRERLDWLAERAMRLIAAAIDRQPEQAARLIEEIGTRYGHGGVYGTCCALSEAIRAWAFPTVKRGDGSLTGDLLGMAKLPGASDDPATDWACRFLTTYVNGDSDTNTALFFGQLGDQELILGGVTALVGMVGSIGRQIEAERSGHAS